jgi:predicted nucleic acid-binding protein
LLVADSGPLIALARLDLLALPAALFAEFLVTATVWREVTQAPRQGEHAALSAAQHEGLLVVVDDPTQMPRALADARLDAGERSALALAVLRQSVVLVDERRGRACAASLGLPVLGTLGLLVRSRTQQLVGPVRPLVNALLASGYHLAQPLVDRALAVVGE